MDIKKPEGTRAQDAFQRGSESLKESALGNATNTLLDDGKRVYNDSKRVANELYEEGKNRVDEAHQSIKEYSDQLATKVNEKPLVSLLVAGGIGFLLSAILRR